MFTRPNPASVYVLDKDGALDFYVNKLGLENGNGAAHGAWSDAHGPECLAIAAIRSTGAAS